MKIRALDPSRCASRCSLALTLALTLACTSAPAADDEAGVTTSPSTDPSDTEASTSAESSTTIGDDEPTFTSSSSDGPFFFGPTDIIESGPCDPFLQDCPEGEKCVPYASSGGTWDASKCVPVMGDQGVGEPCTYADPFVSTDDCDATSWCFNTDDMGVGTCYALCTGTVDMPECPLMSNCSTNGDGSVNVCIPTCDPIAQDCGPGLACYWANYDFSCIFTTSDIPTGEPCGFVNDCAGGNMCVDAAALPSCAGSACCASFCDLGLGDSQCAGSPGTACVAFFEMGQAPFGYEQIGICVLP